MSSLRRSSLERSNTVPLRQVQHEIAEEVVALLKSTNRVNVNPSSGTVFLQIVDSTDKTAAKKIEPPTEQENSGYHRNASINSSSTLDHLPTSDSIVGAQKVTAAIGEPSTFRKSASETRLRTDQYEEGWASGAGISDKEYEPYSAFDLIGLAKRSSPGETIEVSLEELPPEVADLPEVMQKTITATTKTLKHIIKLLAGILAIAASIWMVYATWIVVSFAVNRCVSFDVLEDQPDQFEPLLLAEYSSGGDHLDWNGDPQWDGKKESKEKT